MAPSHAPTSENLPLFRIMSTSTHPKMPVHPAVLVLKIATMARMLAFSVEPPYMLVRLTHSVGVEMELTLNPNHPVQIITVPRNTKVALCGLRNEGAP